MQCNETRPAERPRGRAPSNLARLQRRNGRDGGRARSVYQSDAEASRPIIMGIMQAYVSPPGPRRTHRVLRNRRAAASECMFEASLRNVGQRVVRLPWGTVELI
jgi:hypothetical protein